MDKEKLMKNLKTQLESENPDIQVVKTTINEYKEWMSSSSYKQVDTPVPWLFKLISLFFFGLLLFFIFGLGHSDGGVIFMTVFSGLLFFIGWLLVPLMKLLIRLNGNRQEYIAIVKESMDSLVASKNGVPAKSFRLEIVETGESLICETNGVKVPYDVGDEISILVAFNMWMIK